MTNAEKFFEVFGLEIEKFDPADPCDFIDSEICIHHACENCPANDFWKKEYIRWSEKKKPAL